MEGSTDKGVRVSGNCAESARVREVGGTLVAPKPEPKKLKEGGCLATDVCLELGSAEPSKRQDGGDGSRGGPESGENPARGDEVRRRCRWGVPGEEDPPAVLTTTGCTAPSLEESGSPSTSCTSEDRRRFRWRRSRG